MSSLTVNIKKPNGHHVVVMEDMLSSITVTRGYVETDHNFFNTGNINIRGIAENSGDTAIMDFRRTGVSDATIITNGAYSSNYDATNKKYPGYRSYDTLEAVEATFVNGIVGRKIYTMVPGEEGADRTYKWTYHVPTTGTIDGNQDYRPVG